MYIYLYFYIYAAVSIYIYIWNTDYQKMATSICLLQIKMETANFRVFSANGKQKMESLFFLVSKQKTVTDVCCFSKRAHL
jgi:hypothetical protein